MHFLLKWPILKLSVVLYFNIINFFTVNQPDGSLETLQNTLEKEVPNSLLTQRTSLAADKIDQIQVFNYVAGGFLRHLWTVWWSGPPGWVHPSPPLANEATNCLLPTPTTGPTPPQAPSVRQGLPHYLKVISYLWSLGLKYPTHYYLCSTTGQTCERSFLQIH